MPFSYEDTIIHQGQRLQAERAEAMAQLEMGRVNEDIITVNNASDRILDIDTKYELSLSKTQIRQY